MSSIYQFKENIYFCALLIPTVVMMMKYSAGYKGAWVYKAIPIKNTLLKMVIFYFRGVEVWKL